MKNVTFVPHTNWKNKTSGAVTKTKEIPCLTGKGMPTTSTIGAVGCLYMDTDSGAVYKCTASADGVYTWVDALDSAEMRRVIEAYLEANPPADGEDGGHYTPIVTQPTADTMKVEFAPSKAGMAAVEPVTVKLLSGGSDSGENVYYIATNYGISTEAEDNTPALQALVDAVSAKGGGVIWVPSGAYNFKKASERYAVLLKSNVSIVGENIKNTVFKQVEAAPYAMFYCMASAAAPLVGCSFSNFTVDAYATGDTNEVYGKAFFVQYLRDCVFRDLRLMGTIATAMGIDYLDRVVIDNVTCVDCGRTYTGTESGTSGIGIGTGGWTEENFIVSNCICVGSGQFGIFIENQRVLGWGGNVDYSKGCIIANCIVRDGLNNGIGIRGGENVTVTGCESYENAKHGVYLDNKCKNVKILNCSSTANGADGAYLNANPESSRIVLRGCNFADNEGVGIRVATACDKLCLQSNLTDENSIGMQIGALALRDAVILGNAFMDYFDVSADFVGNSEYNDLTSVDVVAPAAITANPVQVYVGGSAAVSYAVEPINANSKVSFASNNTGVAAVDKDGIVRGVSVGTCDITITSVVDDTVSAVVTCTVSEYVATEPITIPESDFTAGKKLDAVGAETAADGAGVSGFVAVHAVPYLVSVKNLINHGGRVCAYDANKDFLATVSFYDVYRDETIVFTPGMAYLRVSTNALSGVSCTIVPGTKLVDVLSSDVTDGIKLEPSGAESPSDGSSTSGYIPITIPEGATRLYMVPDSTINSPSRIAQYDADKTLLTTDMPVIASGPAEVTLENGAAFIRVCFTNALANGGTMATVYTFVGR